MYDRPKLPHQAERSTEHDGQRHEEALVEGAQDEVDEDDADGEDDNGVRPASGLLAGDAGILVAVAHGQCLPGHFGYGVDDVAR